METNLRTYSRKNHGINAYLKPRVYYYASEDVDKLVSQLKEDNEKLREALRQIDNSLYLGPDLNDKEVLEFYIGVVGEIKKEIESLLTKPEKEHGANNG